MPLPSNPAAVELGEKIIATFDKIFGLHPGYRPVHARGIQVSGTFTPAPGAAALSSAPHFAAPSTPVIARFSSSTGLPAIPDTDPNAAPRGIALRFVLPPGADGHRRHTDIIGHSANGFPARNGQEFLGLFEAIGGLPGAPPVPEFLAAHPAAYAFVTMPKPAPESLATEAYFALHAFKFSGAGSVRFGRYTIEPVAGLAHVGADELAGRAPDYLYAELPRRLAAGPVKFELWVQLAADGDQTDDVTVHWPADRERVLLGTIALDSVVEDNAKAQNQAIFDPIPRVDGIEPSDDPLLELRAAVYLLSGRRRRVAGVPSE